MPEDSELEARIEAVWGTKELPRDVGVLHVVATWFDGQTHRVIRITPDSPKSDTDFFLLNLARARADLILTTGRILREEPSLAYSLPPQWSSAMVRWRAQVLGRHAPPRVAVLTSRRDLDPDHPALHGWARPMVLTSKDAAGALKCSLPGHVDIVGLDATDPRAVIAWARAYGAGTISVEAGPYTTRALYADPILVDELSWSQFCEPTLAHDLRGAVAFPVDPDVGGMRLLASPTTLDEMSGSWRFSRWARPPTS